ncbi:hypothetical protein PCANC_15583 [Puccinia coronata f. sp. avenae]|uniref:Uncharacterized protein n=1 Tax=Puccinia coronata f. sp. avenae TaxID=200324 RepID=A0A2N5SK93_9BASI|nr:hypothetical protein PCANC_15583 [Puccinia coronata f. sp. avenae]
MCHNISPQHPCSSLGKCHASSPQQGRQKATTAHIQPYLTSTSPTGVTSLHHNSSPNSIPPPSLMAQPYSSSSMAEQPLPSASLIILTHNG